MTMNVEQSVEWALTGEAGVLGENLPECYFVHHIFPQSLTWASIRATAVGSRRLTAWAMARPSLHLEYTVKLCKSCTQWNNGRKLDNRSSGKQRRVVRRKSADISEEHIASTLRVQ
jgi:hypothetical protein